MTQCSESGNIPKTVHNCNHWSTDYYVGEWYNYCTWTTCCSGMAFTTSTGTSTHEYTNGFSAPCRDGRVYIISSTAPSKGSYLYLQNKSGEDLYFKDIRSHTYYAVGVKGVMLKTTIPITTYTSGEQTSNYGTNPGWEILK